MNKIRFLVVDDHPIVREGLRLILEMDFQFCSVDEAINGKEALTKLSENFYDLILLDICMPEMNGLDFLKEKKKNGDVTKVVVLTISDDYKTIEQALRLDVNGFILKDSPREEMIEAVNKSIQGEVYLSEEVTEIQKTYQIEKKQNQSEEINLTEKELLVLKEVVKGAPSKKIAIDMGITERTVKAHLTKIYRKLGVASRAEAIAYVIRKKIL